MKLNDKEIIIQPYAAEQVDEETVLFNKAEKKVIVINETATFIWQAIVDADNGKGDLTTEQLAHAICSKYGLPDNEFSNVADDIADTIALFFDVSLLSEIN